MAGETDLDLTEVLTAGETESAFIQVTGSRIFILDKPTEWYTIYSQSYRAGQVRLRLTFRRNVRHSGRLS